MRCRRSSAPTRRLRLTLALLCALAVPGASAQQAAAPAAEPVAALMAAAEEAAAGGNHTFAVHHYHRVLQQEPEHAEARLRLARVLSWSQDYAAAAEQYEVLLAAHPRQQQARQERARVLSWAREFEESLAEYARLIARLEAGEEPEGAAADLHEVRLERARVLGWAQRYEEALAALEALLPAGRKPEARDREALLQRARVLSWSRRYGEALDAYDAVLALDAGDYEARLGRAQTLYWSGRLPQAATLLRALRRQAPERADTGFTLAAVEHHLGYNARALHLLETVPQDAEAQELGGRIRRQLRPVARFRLGLVNAREISAADAALAIPARFSTAKTLRYEGAVEFSVHPDARLEVSNTVAQNLTSNPALGRFGGSAISTQTMARLSFPLAAGLRLTAGAGGGSAGTGRDGALQQARSHHLLYHLHPSYARGPWRVDFTATRSLADHTPLAAHLSAVERREAAAVGYTRRRVRMGGQYWHARYSLASPDATLGADARFRTTADGGSVHVTPALYRDERLTVEAGARYDVFGFARGTSVVLRALGLPPEPPATEREPGSTGFFTPRLYHRVAATGRVAWQASPALHLDVNGTYGPQRITLLPGLAGPAPAFRRTGSIGASATFSLGEFRPVVAWDYFSTDTAFGPGFSPGAQGGRYKAHTVVVGVTRRF